MKKYFLILLVLLFIFNCNGSKQDSKVNLDKVNSKITLNKVILDTLKVKKKLLTINNFNLLLSKIKNVKNVGEKHKDWMSNKARTLDSLFLLDNREFSVKTISYEYKKNVIFYVHDLKHINDTISIKPFLENAQGKTSEGYLGERVLIFAMKNNKDANFIDIPVNWNYGELEDELLEILYKNIDSDVIICRNIDTCIYIRDLRKMKSE